MKNFLFKTIALGLIFTNLAVATTSDNMFHVEALGGIPSLNYERMVKPNFSVRVGGSYLNSNWYKKASVQHPSPIDIVSIPVSGNFILGQHNHKFEIGAGAFLTKAKSATRNAVFIMPTTVLGYRYQPQTSNIMVRAGITTLVDLYTPGKTFQPAPHVGIGYRF